MAQVQFSSGTGSRLSISSSWNAEKETNTMETQTMSELWEFSESETQSGISTDVKQYQVKEKHAGENLLSFLMKVERQSDINWRSAIDDGRVTVDCEVITNVDMKVEEDFFIEFVDCRRDAYTQTSFGSKSNEEGKSGESKQNDIYNENSLSRFLQRVTPMIEIELELNLTSKAFDGLGGNDDYGSGVGGEIGAVGVSSEYWHTLSVDLEKYKVVYPDWSKGKHHPGVITRCSITRTRERVYDIEFDDSIKLFAVREEYIRVLVNEETSKKARSPTRASNDRVTYSRYNEEMRVHVKVGKGSSIKFIPGRIKKASSNNVYDVECEGGRLERGVPFEDLLCGLDSGQLVEARRPQRVELQCTSLDWSCTGSALAVSYGQRGVTGWCEVPGAVCIWSIFSRKFAPDTPEYVLDHSCSINKVAYHPEVPSLLAGGSFDGELLVWDLASKTPDQPLCISTISESASKEPLMDVKWVFDSALDQFLVATVSADGKLLFWSLDNKLKYPVRGSLLTVPHKSKRGGSSGNNHYPVSHGGVSLAFSGGSASHRPIWSIVGQEGGSIVRSPITRVLGGQLCKEEDLKSTDAFPQFRRKDDENFKFDSHIGSVRALHFSPFHRNLFLSAGEDGLVKLFHVLEGKPLLEWEPAFQSALAVQDVMTGLTAVAFSPIRPTVFAASAGDGCVYLFDLSQSKSTVVHTLEAPVVQPALRAGNSRGASSKENKRTALTGIAFNSKQRDLIAACDLSGRIHIWKLGGNLSVRRPADQVLLDSLGSSASSDKE